MQATIYEASIQLKKKKKRCLADQFLPFLLDFIV